jgi:hypothetical protein
MVRPDSGVDHVRRLGRGNPVRNIAPEKVLHVRLAGQHIYTQVLSQREIMSDSWLQIINSTEQFHIRSPQQVTICSHS